MPELVRSWAVKSGTYPHMAVRSSRVRIFSWSWAVQTGPHTHMAVRACPVLDGRAEKQRFLVKKVKKGKWSKRASGQKGKWSKRASGQKGQKGQARGGAVHEPSSLPGKPTDETPGKGRNRSCQPSSLEIPSAVPAERHFKGKWSKRAGKTRVRVCAFSIIQTSCRHILQLSCLLHHP